MKKLRGRRPSPSLLISCVALALAFGALAGTAFSGGSRVPGKGGVKASDIAKNAIKAGKIKAGAVTRPKLAGNSVTGAKLANNAVTEAKLANGAVTDAKLGTIVERTGTVTLPADAVPGDGLVTSDAGNVDCASGERVIGGGFSYTGAINTPLVAIRSSFRQGNGWHTVVINDSGLAQTGTRYAYCLQ